MHTLAVAPELSKEVTLRATKAGIDLAVDNIIASLPAADQLTSKQRRDLIARYTSVLEGNFIYWMTAAFLALRSDEARPIIIDNLMEEVRDSHPAMLRKFAIAAHAFPTDVDALAVNDELDRVRLFFGRLAGVPILATMAFFEQFIQRFMSYLADLAVAQGSTELEYTDVHGVCDIAHSEGLIQALSIEMELSPQSSEADIFEGVKLVETLINRIIGGGSTVVAA